jgi:hypothetical protein
LDHVLYDYIEELLLHSFTHASLDFSFERNWPIVNPRDFSTIQSDVAETIFAYLASRWRPERFDPTLIEYVETKLQHRFQVLDNLNMELP